MTSLNSYAVIICVLLWLASTHASAISLPDPQLMFADVVQGHDAGFESACSTLTATNQSLIKGGGSPALAICNIGQDPNNGNCSDAQGNRKFCTARGKDAQIAKPELPAFLYSNQNTTLSYNNGQQVLLGENGQSEFGTINIDSASVTFSDKQKTYKIKKLTLFNNSPKIVLGPGDYWIEQLDVSGGRIELSQPGVTRIFVKNNVSLRNRSSFNPPLPGASLPVGSLLLYAYADLKIDGNTSYGYFFAFNRIELINNAQVNGRLSALHIRIQDSYLNDKPQNIVPPSTINHYQLRYSGQALTCEQATVAMLACQNDDCSVRYNAEAKVSLLPATGWSRNPVTIAAGGQANLTLSRLSSGKIALGLASAAPSAPLRCYRDGELASDCAIEFTDAALRFDFPTFYAGESATTTIRAIKSANSGATPVCVPLLTGNQALVVGYSKLVTDPASVAAPTINGHALAPDGKVNVLFDGKGEGRLTLQYPDAGVLRLDATFPKSDSSGTLKLIGSDAVAVIPKGIVLQVDTQVGCSGGDDRGFAACPVYQQAGKDYSLLSGAVNAQGHVTPGFAASDLGLTWRLVAPATGQLGDASPAVITLAAGLGKTVARWSEVGFVGVGVRSFVPYPRYQDESPPLEVPLRWSAPIGRFVPADFELVKGDVVPGCGNFSYMGQSVGVNLQIRARNAAGGLTSNYTGAFAKGDGFITTANNKNGIPLTARLRSLPALPWHNGQALFNGSSEFARLADHLPDGPYEALLFGVLMRDNDGDHTQMANPDFNEAVVGDCRGSGCNARLIDSVPMKVYFGRLLAGTEAGVASAPLAIPQRMQYYEAGNWQLNKEDQCTRLSLAGDGIRFLNPGHSFDAVTRDLNLGAGRKIRLGLGSSAPGGDMAQAKDGEILFYFAKPDMAVRIPYKMDLATQPSQPRWLSDPLSLQGEVIFGSSRGNDRIIYRREVLH